jgi:hypothetical protein
VVQIDGLTVVTDWRSTLDHAIDVAHVVHDGIQNSTEAAMESPSRNSVARLGSWTS